MSDIGSVLEKNPTNGEWLAIGSGRDPAQLVFEEITLGGKPPPLRIAYADVPIEKLDFDPDNPRLRYMRAMNPGAGDVELLIGNNEGSWLKRDILINGLIDPIYVKELGDRFLVIEGNRRTACVTELHAAHPTDPRFATMRCRVLPSQTTESQTALLMASFHVAGKVKWDAHEKAGHVYHMLKKLRIPTDELIPTLHMGRPAIERTAESFAILEEVYKQIDGGAYARNADGKWSYFDEFLKNKKLRDMHRSDSDFKNRFSRWVGECRLPTAETVRDLPEILAKPQSRDLFLNSPAAEAFQKALDVSNKDRPQNNSRFFKKLNEVLYACEHATLADIELAAGNETAKVNLQETYRSLSSFMERAGIVRPRT